MDKPNVVVTDDDRIALLCVFAFLMGCKHSGVTVERAIEVGIRKYGADSVDLIKEYAPKIFEDERA